MTDETNAQAEMPADDGIIDLDQVEAPVVEKSDGEKPEQDEAKPEDQADQKDGEGDGEGEEDKPRKRSGVTRLKARNSQLMEELSARERELEELRSRAATAGDEDKEPKEEDFDGDYFAYQRALAAFDTRKIIREEGRASQVRNLDAQRSNILRERSEAHQERVEAAKEFITDYDEVVSKAPPVSREVGQELLSSDKSELIVYHLAKHPEQIHALNNMTGRELAREIGRLEGSVSAPSAKKQTSAPPPPTALKGGSTPRNPESDLSAWLKKTYG
jgi:hypothetical protein